MNKLRNKIAEIITNKYRYVICVAQLQQNCNCPKCIADAILDIEIERECEKCNGTGMEICDNPDHDAIESGLVNHWDRHLGCPCCGHDELYRIPKTKCDKCNGTGEVKIKLSGLV